MRNLSFSINMHPRRPLHPGGQWCLQAKFQPQKPSQLSKPDDNHTDLA